MFSEKLKRLPDSPGVYFFYNKEGVLIYAGKATSLKDRVKSYWKGTKSFRPIEEMLHEVADIKWEKTGSALEAAILEGKYIKKFRPRYNVKWRDDKSWNYLAFTKDEYPRLISVREHELPVIASEAKQSHRNNVISSVEREISTGKRSGDSPEASSGSRPARRDSVVSLGMTVGIAASPAAPRNDRYIFGPYPGLNVGAAMKILRHIFHFSDCWPPAKDGKPPAAPLGKGGGPKPCFYRQLGQCVGVCEGTITPAEYRRKVVKPMVEFLRGGKIRLLKSLTKEMVTASKNKNYEEAARLRDQIRSLRKIQDAALINESFVGLEEGKPLCVPPWKGGKAVPPSFLRIRPDVHRGYGVPFAGQEGAGGVAEDMRIEGYDISNLGATGKVGSMVVFDEQGPIKSEYRKFNIKTVVGQSDVECLQEVLRRRLKHTEWSLPDIFLIDGGLPQIGAAARIIRGYGISRPIIGIAKGPRRKNNKFIIDADYTDSKTDSADIKNIADWLKDNKNLLIRVRDEAHRFALAFHRRKRVL